MTATEHNTYPNGRWSGESPRPIMPANPNALQEHESMELQLCEQRIERGLETFLEVGLSLSLIRDKRLYRSTHETFEAYCLERWEFAASRARQLCAAAEVIINLGLTSDGPNALRESFVMPASERHLRPLVGMPPEVQREVWAEVTRSAPNGRVTAQHVTNVARPHRERLGLSVASETPRQPAPAPAATSPRPIDVGSKADQLRAATDNAIAKVRELLDLNGTPDSAAASDVVVSLTKLETFRDHLKRVETSQSSRS